MNITFANAVPHTLDFSCSSCGASLSISMNLAPKMVLNTPQISFESPCPKCNSEIKGIGGKYETKDGKLVRVGDYDGDFKDGQQNQIE